MSSTKSIYDDPAFMKMVMDEFKGRWPTAALRLTQPLHIDNTAATALWLGFKKGVEFAVTEGLKEGEG
ncbi:hypothetical protein CEE36_11390 [candidate division TA06 bacterium B3_TA06]|uniref:Uncharacterized protein n=1 Tax=candidate division TA06 bacterium B3_TA06 TaxID=2012487 RepID=A0A532UPP2_UNCT6|nr:MAG: hypothetical protein CEE36_11390 [candidate division TA06 bacterium B3_TA06]